MEEEFDDNINLDSFNPKDEDLENDPDFDDFEDDVVDGFGDEDEDDDEIFDE